MHRQETIDTTVPPPDGKFHSLQHSYNSSVTQSYKYKFKTTKQPTAKYYINNCSILNNIANLILKTNKLENQVESTLASWLS